MIQRRQRTLLTAMGCLVSSIGIGWWFHTTSATLVRQPAATLEPPALARTVTPPLGLPPVPVPDDNPLTVARIHLGRKLFFDRRLSRNNTMSCAMCHVPEQGFTVNELAQAVGIEGHSLRRNAPTLLNVAYMHSHFHDGRETSLETQVISPFLAHNEMANPSMGHLVEKIRCLDDYADLFVQAFGRGPSVETIGQALASYERTLLAANAPFDRWYYGQQPDALSPQAQTGFQLFVGKARCVSCHTITEQYCPVYRSGLPQHWPGVVQHHGTRAASRPHPRAARPRRVYRRSRQRLLPASAHRRTPTWGAMRSRSCLPIAGAIKPRRCAMSR